MRSALFVSVALLLALMFSTAALADAAFTVSVAQGAAPNLWEYTLTNNDPSGKMRSLSLTLYWNTEMEPGEPLSIEGTPIDDGEPANGFEGNWVDVGDGSAYVAWINLTPDALNPPPLSGQSLSGFIVSANSFVPYFDVEYYDIDDPQFADPFVTGILPVTVNVVPEPASFVVLLGALGCAAPILRRSRS